MDDFKVKKSFDWVKVILIVITVAMGGYLVYDKILVNVLDDDNSINNSENIKINEEKSFVYDADYDYTALADSYSTYFSTYKVGDIVVPYININSKDAKTANDEIKEVFEDAIDNFNIGVYDKVNYVDVCKYDSYIYDNILSVVLTYGVGSTDVVHPDYYTYNFDLTTGKLLTYKEVYESLGYSSSSITNKAKTTITNIMSVELSDYVDTGDGGYYPEGTNFDTYNNKSISNYNKSVSDNSIGYFIDSNRKMNIIVVLNIPAGSEEFNTVIKLN